MGANGTGPLRVGIVGCGWVSEICHLPALRDLPQATAVAVTDVDRTRAERLAARFQVQRCHADYRALLDDPSVEAVAVCVPSGSHLEVASTALEAGKHVLLEKPLMANLDQCDHLIERAARSPKKVLVGFNMRHHDLVRRARDIIARGALDPIQSMSTVFTSDTVHKADVSPWRKRRQLGGGALIEQAIHHFDLWRFLLQSEAVQVFATSAARDWEDETATVTARMANGVLAASMFSESTSNNNEVDVCGRKGRLHFSSYCFDGLEVYGIKDSPGDLRTRLQRIGRVIRELPRGLQNMRHGGEFMSTFRAQWRHFADCIRTDAPLACSLEDGRRTLQLLLAIVQSASLGQPVTVAEAPRTITDVAAQNAGAWNVGAR
jgi:predicted dehydrogenase